jgi:hypothetical protein
MAIKLAGAMLVAVGQDLGHQLVVALFDPVSAAAITA